MKSSFSSFGWRSYPLPCLGLLYAFGCGTGFHNVVQRLVYNVLRLFSTLMAHIDFQAIQSRWLTFGSLPLSLRDRFLRAIRWNTNN